MAGGQRRSNEAAAPLARAGSETGVDGCAGLQSDHRTCHEHSSNGVRGVLGTPAVLVSRRGPGDLSAGRIPASYPCVIPGESLASVPWFGAGADTLPPPLCLDAGASGVGQCGQARRPAIRNRFPCCRSTRDDGGNALPRGPDRAAREDGPTIKKPATRAGLGEVSLTQSR